MAIRIGEAVSLSRPDSWKFTPDDRQTMIETAEGNIVQDYGVHDSGGKVRCSVTFHRKEFLKVWDYFVSREPVNVTDHAGNMWKGMRVKVVSYGYESRFEDYINTELEFWRI